MTTRPDLLFMAHRVPYPPDKGDRIRTFHLLKFLAGHAKIHLAALADEPVTEEARRVLAGLCERVTIASLGGGRWLRGLGSLIGGGSISEGVFRSSELARTLKVWSAETPFQAALASASSVAPYLWIGGLAKVPAIVDLVDVDSQKWFDYAATSSFPRSWLYQLEGGRLRKTEQAISSWAEAVTLVSDAEASLFRDVAPRAHIQAVTNGVDLEYYRPENLEVADGCVFVGAFDYLPNVDAAVWFVREVWTEVRRRHPEARFRLVGRNPVKSVRQLAEMPGVEVIGTVPDVRPFIRAAAVVVAPLRIARGLQNKVLEALAMGKAVVASPQSLTGFRSDMPAVKANSPIEWCDAIGRMFSDSAARQKLGEQGRAFAEAHHNWERCLTPFLELLGLQNANDVAARPTKNTA